MNKIYIFAIPFLTICATLYHIVYWTKFGINGLEIIGIEDIIKTTIQPVFFAIFLLLQNTLTINFIFNKNKIETNNYTFNPLIYFSSWIAIIGLFIVSTIVFNYFTLSRIYIVGFLAWLSIKFYISDLKFFKEHFKNILKRNIFIDFLVATPLIFFVGGYYNSELIYRNVEYKYLIKNQTIPNNIYTNIPDTIKVIGFSQNFIVLTTLKNEEMIFLNKDNISSFVLKDYKKNRGLFD